MLENSHQAKPKRCWLAWTTPALPHYALGIAVWALPACEAAPASEQTSPHEDPPNRAAARDAAADAQAGAPLRVSFLPLNLPEEFRKGLLGHRFLPGGEELLVWTKLGAVGHFRLQGDELTLLGQFDLEVGEPAGDCGISGAVDPMFDETGYLFFGLCDSPQYGAVYRFSFDADNYAAISRSKLQVLSAGDDRATKSIHNLGAIGFGDDGHLWALFGDKGRSSNAQNMSSNLGALVRLADPARSPDIYAKGLRSPWTGLVDHRGFYWVGDVGADDAEEVNLITAGGQNFGWPESEGRCNAEVANCSGLSQPLLHWDRSFEHPYVLDDPEVTTSNKRVVWVGTEYLPNEHDRYGGKLNHRVLFGDMCLGFVRAAQVNDAGVLIEDQHLGHLAGPTTWEQGADGYVYVSTWGRCSAGQLDAPPTGNLWRMLRVSE